MARLTETYADKIVGILSCFDRVMITGSLVDIAYAEAMAKTLWISGVRFFDYTQFTVDSVPSCASRETCPALVAAKTL